MGDSFTWGSGLSDEETVPWRLAKILTVPVFNAACPLESVINSGNLRGVQVIIEEVSAHSISKKLFEKEFIPEEYEPLRLQRAAKSISVKRYFVAAKIFRMLQTMLSDVARAILKPEPRDGYLFRGDLQIPHDTDGLEEVVRNVVRRSERIRSFGYHYVRVQRVLTDEVCQAAISSMGLV